jgi:hypothetical protein
MECELIKGIDSIKKIPFPDGRKRTKVEEFCLNNCPYPKCVEDIREKRDFESMMRRVKRGERISKRNKRILNLAASKTERELAGTFNLSRRRVRQILQQQRENN